MSTAGPSIRPRPTTLVAAFAGLVASDAVVRLFGFPTLHKVVKRCPTLGRRESDGLRAAAISSAVDAAASYYPKRAWCLQRSAVATCLLRLHGIPAQMVLGVRPRPFDAHAWVEWRGRILNDEPTIRERYRELERC